MGRWSDGQMGRWSDGQMGRWSDGQINKKVKKKIVLLGPAYPFRGGIAAFNDRLAIALEEAGNSVSLVNFTTQYPAVLFPGKTQFSESKAPHSIQSVRKLSSINPFTWISTAKYINDLKPDIVIVRYWLPFMGPALGSCVRMIKKSNTTILCIADNVIPHESRPLDKAFTRYFLKPIHGFLVMTQSVLDDLHQFNSTKPKQLSPHPLYDNFGKKFEKAEAIHRLNLDPSYQYILFFGLVRDYKGLDLLLEAMLDRELQDSNIKLLIAGEAYGSTEAYDMLLEKEELQDKVIWKNAFIPDEEVAYYFSAAECVVQPYKTATQSGVTQIAYHFNTPMIVTDVGGLAEMCPNGKVGYVSKPDAESVAKAILKFLSTDPSIFQNGIQIEKKRYSWSTFVENLMRLEARSLEMKQ